MWWFGQTQTLPKGMIDLHNHVAPAIDDGARSDDESIEMLRLFSDAGYAQIALSPHLNHPRFPEVTAAQINERTAHVAALAQTAGLSLKVHPGAEIFCQYHEQLLQQLADDQLVPLGEGGIYYLIEFAVNDPMVAMKELAFTLTVQGARPILAHPERYHTLQRKPALAQEWRHAGWLLQLDIASLLGASGRKVKKLCHKLLRERSFDLAASDLHSPLLPQGHFHKMLTLLPKAVGSEEAHRLLVENPRRILQGQPTLDAKDLDD